MILNWDYSETKKKKVCRLGQNFKLYFCWLDLDNFCWFGLEGYMYCYCLISFKNNCLNPPKIIMHCFVEFASARTTYFLKFVWSAELDWREDLLIGIVLVRCGLNMELLWVLGRRLDWLHYWRAALLNYVEFCRVEDRADCIAIIYLYYKVGQAGRIKVIFVGGRTGRIKWFCGWFIYRKNRSFINIYSC